MAAPLPRVWARHEQAERQRLAGEPMARVLGRLILDARRAHDLSQAELARIASVSRETISRVERARGRVTLDSLARLAHALGLRASRLIARAESIALADKTNAPGKTPEQVERCNPARNTRRVASAGQNPGQNP